MLDPHQVGDLVPQRDRDHGHHGGDHNHRFRPARQGRQHPPANAEVPEDALARRRHLHGLSDDGEDEQVADQRRQRAVVVDDAREHERRAQRDDVVDDHRYGQTCRLCRLGTAQAHERRRAPLPQRSHRSYRRRRPRACVLRAHQLDQATESARSINGARLGCR